MKVFVDTNLFIDILLDREPFADTSSTIYTLCENSILDGYIAPITINNIYYICRKARRIETIKEFLFDISTLFTVAPLDAETIKKANALAMNDYEDALQYAMAIQNVSEYFITRNTKDFKRVSHIPVLTPEAFLSQW